MATKDDMADERVPKCMHWTEKDVADFIENLGYPFYRECFISNQINGRRLILIDASALPSIGITDFIHIKDITKAIRELLKIEYPDWSRSISLPPREDLGMFLERKSTTGEKSNVLTYEAFLRDVEDYKWRAPLSNQTLILPH